MIYRKHHSVPINHVNPIYINNLEPIHMVVGSLIANHLAWAKIPTNHDRLYRRVKSIDAREGRFTGTRSSRGTRTAPRTGERSPLHEYRSLGGCFRLRMVGRFRGFGFGGHGLNAGIECR
jgi:hypothetical protein